MFACHRGGDAVAMAAVIQLLPDACVFPSWLLPNLDIVSDPFLSTYRATLKSYNHRD